MASKATVKYYGYTAGTLITEVNGILLLVTGTESGKRNQEESLRASAILYPQKQTINIPNFKT
jgi:hypothetical protein